MLLISTAAKRTQIVYFSNVILSLYVYSSSVTSDLYTLTRGEGSDSLE